MENKKVLSREEFRKAFIEPLENKFKFKVHWNSKELIYLGLKPTPSHYKGVSYCSREGCPIVMKYRKNTLDMLATLIHENAHSYLHNMSKKVGYNLSKNMKEYEAESVVKEVFNILNLEYQREDYILHYYNKCSSNEIFECNQLKRYDLIEQLAKEISDLLFPKINLIKELNSHTEKESFKYQVYCKCCNKIISKYKRKSNIIKCNAKDYYCIRCGKDESLNQLVVSEI